VQMLGRTFQANWKCKYQWIDYNAAKNKVFCEVCTVGLWILFFSLSSLEPFALGYIDIDFSYASPVCRLCVFVKESVCVCAGVHVCKIATSHANPQAET